MYLVHWLNGKDNTTYFRYIKFLPLDYIEGYENSNCHIIISIYYIDFDNNNKLYTYEEFEATFLRHKEISKSKKFKKGVINLIINLLEELK